MNQHMWMACLGLALLSGCARDETDRYLRGLQSANPVFQKQSVTYLAQHGCSRAVPELLAMLERGPAADLKLAVVEALGHLGDRRAAPHLLRLLQDPALEVRTAAIVAMTKIKAPEFVAPLSAAARTGDARLPAIWALGALGDPAAVPVLAELLRDPDKYVRYNAQQALKRLTN